MKAKNKHYGLRVLRQRESRNSSWFTTIQKFTLLIPNFRIYLRCIRDEIYWAVLKRLLSFIFLRFSNEKLSCATFSTNQRKKDFILPCSKDFSRARSRLSRFTMFTDCFLDWRITHAHNDTGSGCAVPSSQCIVGLLKQLECLTFRLRATIPSEDLDDATLIQIGIQLLYFAFKDVKTWLDS